MVIRVKKRICMLLLPMLATGALGQEITTEEQRPVVRRYTVEMIIFSYAQNVSAGSEVFMPDEPPPIEPGMEGELIDDLMQDEAAEPAVPEEPAAEDPEEADSEEALDDDERPYELVMLPEEDFALLDIFERLDNLDAYTPLMHFGWTQPTYPREETEARPLGSFMTPPEGLEGDLSLYLSRYLHLGVNLQLEAPGTEDEEEPLSLDDLTTRFTTASRKTESSETENYATTIIRSSAFWPRSHAWKKSMRMNSRKSYSGSTESRFANNTLALVAGHEYYIASRLKALNNLGQSDDDTAG